MSPEDPKLALQVRVSKMLGYGFAFSLVVSGGELSGMWMAWWCIIVGGLGAVMLPLLVWRFIRVVSR